MTSPAAPASTASRPRAARMPPAERREMIAAAAVPLFLEHGASLSTRQLAESLGIAEGTVFRAFGDKDTLVRAVVTTFFEQARIRRLADVADPQLSLEEKITRFVRGTRQWMHDVFQMLSLLPRDEAPQYLSRGDDAEYRAVVAKVFAPDASQLRLPPDRMAAVLRIAGFAASAARGGAQAALSEEDLVQFILYGIAGAPRGREGPCSEDS